MFRLSLWNFSLVQMEIGVQVNSKKAIEINTYQQVFFFQATNKTIGSATYRTYFCKIYELYIKWNFSNIIHRITCSNSFMQYVGENS